VPSHASSLPGQRKHIKRFKVESTPETQHQAEFFCQSWMSFGSTRDCCGSKTMVQNQETLTK